MTTLADRAVTTNDTRIAHHVMGRLLNAIPASIRLATWRISGGELGVQRDSYGSDDDARRDIRSLASLLNLDYAEVRNARDTFTTISASGLYEGVRVEFWDHVERNYKNGGAS